MGLAPKDILTYLILILLSINFPLFAGQTECWLKRIDASDNFAVLGDTVSFDLLIDTNDEQITGVSLFLTFDPAIFKPVFYQTRRPFTPGTLITDSNPLENSTHFDEWGKDDMLNEIPGFQLDYIHQTGIAVDGVRPSVKGRRPAANIKFIIIGTPEDSTKEVFLDFDFDNFYSRYTSYFLLGAPGTRQNFRKVRGYSLKVMGMKISSALSDTLIIPGDQLTIDLDNYIRGNDDYDVLWNYEILQPLADTDIFLNNNELIINTDPSAHGILILKITSSQPETESYDERIVTYYFNHRPQFNSVMPILRFNEDESLTLLKSDLLTDSDDDLRDLILKFETSQLKIDTTDTQFIISAEKDWFGQEDVRLIVQDEIQIAMRDSVETMLAFTVVPVNDPPVLDVLALETLTLNPSLPYSLNMQAGMHVMDVDDTRFLWQVQSSDTTILSASFTDNVLLLEVQDDDFAGKVPITITVADEYGATDSEIVEMRINPLSVHLNPFPAFVIFPDSNFIVHLNEYVQYPVELKGELDWEFTVMNSETGLADPKVTAAWNASEQTLTITTQPNHFALDELSINVSAGLGIEDAGVTSLTVLPEPRLFVLPLPEIRIEPGALRNVLDLDGYVFDPDDTPEEIEWRWFGGDSLTGVVIDPLTHIVTLQTDTAFVGFDSVWCVATNTIGQQDTACLVVECRKLALYPVIDPPLPDLSLPWRKTTPVEYVDLDDYVTDAGTQDAFIQWKFIYDERYLQLLKDENNLLKVRTFDLGGIQSVILQATNLLGNTTADTVVITILKQGLPQWRTIPTIEFLNSQIFSALYLDNFCTDPAGQDLAWAAKCSQPNLRVSINEFTSQVTLTPLNGFSGQATVVFTASNEDTSANSNLVEIRVGRRSNIACFFNTTQPGNLNFIINSDLNIERVEGLLSFNSIYETLEFDLLDVLSNQKVWLAPALIDKNGSWGLISKLYSKDGLITSDSLYISSKLAKSSSGQFPNAGNLLLIHYPENEYSNSRQYLLLEENFPDWGSGTNEKKYTLKSNGAASEMVLVQLKGKPGNASFSFYQITDDQKSILETTVDETGLFSTQVKINQSFTFLKSEIPAKLKRALTPQLHCFPNPFNSQIKIEFEITKKGAVDLLIYNMLGQTVVRRSFSFSAPGRYFNLWDGTDKHALPVPSGVYFVKISVENQTELVKKILLLK